MKLLIPVESIIQNVGGIILYDPHENKILKEYVHDKKWKRSGWRGGIIFQDYLIATDWTDIHYFNIKKWKYERSFIKKTFNDLHYLEVRDNHLYVVNTGLDCIEILSNPLEPKSEEMIFLFEVFPEVFEKRKIDLSQSYNDKLKIRPHVAHPNCITFSPEGDMIVTCFGQPPKVNHGNIVNVTKKTIIFSRRYDCHDGLFYRGKFFTTLTRQSKILSAKMEKFPTKPDIFLNLKRKGWWRGMVIHDDIIYLFASDGYRGKKTTATLAIIDMKTKNVKFQKLPVFSSIHWDTVYQPNLLLEGDIG